MNNSEDKIEFNYTVILDPLGREFDAAAFTQDELSNNFFCSHKEFNYRYKTYYIRAYWISYAGEPHTQIYQAVINKINSELGICQDVYFSENYSPWGMVHCSRGYNIYETHNPLEYVIEEIGKGGFNYTYDVTHRLDSLDVPTILKGFNKTKPSFETRNIAALRTNYNISIDKREQASAKVNALRREMDESLRSAYQKFTKRAKEIQKSQFSYSIIKDGDLISINDSNGIMILYKCEGLYKAHDVEHKMAISFSKLGLKFRSEYDASDLTKVICYSVRKVCGKTGKLLMDNGDVLDASLDITSYGQMFRVNNERIVSIYENSMTLDTPKTPRKMIRNGGNKLVKAKPVEVTVAGGKTSTEIINELNLVKNEMMHTIELILFGYYTLIEKVEESIKEKTDNYNSGDVVLSQINNYYSLMKIVGKPKIVSEKVLYFSTCRRSGYIDMDNTKMTKRDFNINAKLNTHSLICSSGYVSDHPNRNSLVLIKNLIKKMGYITDDQVLCSNELSMMLALGIKDAANEVVVS
jgi:hypothetical protein